MEIHGKKIVVEGKLPRIARPEEEWFDDVEHPEPLIDTLKEQIDADILTFWQRLPELEPKYSYMMEFDPIAALPITTYSNWWEKQINSAARNKVRKAQKKGIVVRTATFDDETIKGITAIFNVTPIRQGRRFLGAYLDGELVGFIMLADAGRYAVLGQIISKIGKRDFAPTNALLAKAVERCAEREIPYLTYAFWLGDGLGEFKRNNGFQKFDLPRYFIPLTKTGEVALKLGLHRGWTEAIPDRIKSPLKKVRKFWYGFSGSN